MDAQQPLKIIQWATGNIGARSLRALVEHPGLELAGLWVSAEAKRGLDAAELCGLENATGIVSTNSASELIEQDADCVLYMRQGTDIDELCKMLASGKNVVTTRGDFHHPPMMEGAARQKIEQACSDGNSSIYSTGSSPGFVTEALALPLLSLSRRLDCLTIDEFADVGSRNSPQLLFEIMGFGKPMTAFNQASADFVKTDFAASLAQVAKASGITIDRWEAHGDYSPASETIKIAAGEIGKGSIAAQRITISGFCDDRLRFRFRAHWYASDRIENTDWNLRESGWRIQVAGDTPLDVAIAFPVAPEDYAAFTPGLTAHRAVNAVPAVCAAPAGIRTTADLAQVVAWLGE
ncbi:dihydrodipicolinate reductase [Parasphingorhabdus sp.]|uniref:NAD(P)H-dependent amine dehydrogenase family protein n=1 Tax=Parasphingorhabdus sp. TaxID=2709688 RepID=UPI003A930BE8